MEEPTGFRNEEDAYDNQRYQSEANIKSPALIKNLESGQKSGNLSLNLRDLNSQRKNSEAKALRRNELF